MYYCNSLIGLRKKSLTKGNIVLLAYTLFEEIIEVYSHKLLRRRCGVHHCHVEKIFTNPFPLLI